jgi:hypothetical protein
MHAAQGARLVIERKIALRHTWKEAVFFELTTAEGSGEEPTVVFNELRVDDNCTWELGFGEIHLALQ